MESDKENSMLRTSFMSPTVARTAADQCSLRATNKPTTSMRPLTSSFKSAASEMEVLYNVTLFN